MILLPTAFPLAGVVALVVALALAVAVVVVVAVALVVAFVLHYSRSCAENGYGTRGKNPLDAAGRPAGKTPWIPT